MVTFVGVLAQPGDRPSVRAVIGYVAFVTLAQKVIVKRLERAARSFGRDPD